jgi:hypothetical protein
MLREVRLSKEANMVCQVKAQEKEVNNMFIRRQKGGGADAWIAITG